MYGCDCDGIARSPVDAGREGDAVRHHLRTIEHTAGYRPPTCPWRAMSEPIVREVRAIAWAIDPANLHAALGPDPDAKLVQSIGVYRAARVGTEADETRLRNEESASERRARAAAAKAAGCRHG